MVRLRVFGMKLPTLAAVREIADESEGLHGTALFESMRDHPVEAAAKARR
jgi:hypothetical protein